MRRGGRSGLFIVDARRVRIRRGPWGNCVDRFARIVAVFIVLVLAACAGAARRDAAEAALAGGDVIAGFRTVRADLVGGSGDSNRRKALELFTPDRRAQLDAAYVTQIQNLTSTASAILLRGDVSAAGQAGVMSRERAAELSDAVHDRLTAQIVAGVVQPTVSELLNEMSVVLERPAVAPKAVRNTLSILGRDPATKSTPRRSETTALFRYISLSGKSFFPLVEAELPNLSFSLVELKYDISPQFPEFARERMEPMIADTVVMSSASDRLVAIDLTDRLRRYEDIRIVEGPTVAEAIVDIDELQYREREQGPSLRRVAVPPNRVEEVYVPDHIPEGSSFIYDVEESAFELEWAYEIRVETRDGRQSSDVVRGTERRTGYRCLGFAYVTPTGVFIPDDEGPNYDVRSFCRDGQPLRTGDIRPEILNRLSARAHALIDRLGASGER